MHSRGRWRDYSRSAGATRATARWRLGGLGDQVALGVRVVAVVQLQRDPDGGRRPGDVEAVPGAAGDPRLDHALVREYAPAGIEVVPGPVGVAFGGVAEPQGDGLGIDRPEPGLQAHLGRDVLELVAVAAQGDRLPQLIGGGEG